MAEACFNSYLCTVRTSYLEMQTNPSYYINIYTEIYTQYSKKWRRFALIHTSALSEHLTWDLETCYNSNAN